MNNAQLDARLRAANPVPSGPVGSNTARSPYSRLGDIAIAVLVILTVGVGVAWAATGKNPITSLFGETLKVSESETGFEFISSLKPMTPETLETLPVAAAETAVIRAADATLKQDSSQQGRTIDNYKPDESLISGYAKVRSNLGTPQLLLVVDEAICSFSGVDEYHSGNCFPSQVVKLGNATTWFPENERTSSFRLTGIFDDRVAAVDIVEDKKPPIEIPSNILELREVSSGPLTIIGLDREGSELFHRSVAIDRGP